MVTLEQIKNILRVDTDEDDAYLELLIKAAEEYISAAVGAYPQSARADILTAFLVSTMYETRSFAVDKEDKRQAVVQSMLIQLQLEQGGGESYGN
jgi:uncharacterized phage protein (predicted DNA packaging)